MRFLCTTALVVLAGAGLAASPAVAQYGSPRPLPLPPVATPSVVAVSYDFPAQNAGPYGSMFVSQEATTPAAPTPPPAAGSPSDEKLIEGAHGATQFQNAASSEWAECSDDCGGCGRWFGGLGALVMGRNRPNAFWTTSDAASGDLVMNTQSAGANWAGGWQVSVGYMFGAGDAGSGCNPMGPYAGCSGCGGCGATGPGIGFTYWGLGNMNGFAQVDSGTNQLNSTFTLLDPSTGSGQVEINGQPFDAFFDNAASQRISRDDNANNYELNLYFGAFQHYRWTLVPFIGFRAFQFHERLAYESLIGGSTWGANGGADQASLSFGTINNLYGLQLGTYATYQFGDRFGWFIGPKLGIMGNQMSNRARLASGDGSLGFDVTAHKSDFSLLGEIDTGFTWIFGPHFMAYMGYRVLGVTNVALGDNQFVQGLGDVQQSGSLILHGLMVGGGWSF